MGKLHDEIEAISTRQGKEPEAGWSRMVMLLEELGVDAPAASDPDDPPLRYAPFTVIDGGLS